MNYIELINWFWQCDEAWEFTAIETRLYLYLLKVANTLSWQQNPFWHSDKKTSIGARCSLTSLKTARNRLVQAELIKVYPGGKGYGDKTRYQILTPKPQSKPQPKSVAEDAPSVEVKDYIDRVIGAYAESYRSTRGCDYEIMSKGKERSAAGKLLKLYRDKHRGSSSEKTIADLSQYFVQCLNIGNEWLYNNMSLPIIVSKFNEINTILRNGSKGCNSKKPATSSEELAGIVAKHFASDFEG